VKLLLRRLGIPLPRGDHGCLDVRARLLGDGMVGAPRAGDERAHRREPGTSSSTPGSHFVQSFALLRPNVRDFACVVFDMKICRLIDVLVASVVVV